MMLKSVSLRQNYNSESRGFSGTVVVSAGDVDLRASLTDDISATTWPTLDSLSLSVEKPGSFAIDYDLPNKDFRFQFKKKVKVLEKPLKLTYTHMMGENQTSLNGMLELNSANKLSVDYAFDFGDCKLMYSYAHGGMTLEPCYDFGKKSLDFTMSQRILDGDLIGASYKTSSKALGLEWSSNSKYSENLRFKISASFDLAKGLHIPKLNAESTWDF
ncbi:outer envelope pore protein 24B, chloroplastic [Quercus suber]|uniref:Outer envelope pore protein 24b n=1 Tax=Quercus suber TaxID=58331 RepID=A0AAW0KVI6_QUESU|nr:outer envelope pore protein 24B, chloroplastic-like [Quercus suber]POE59984.1 outer envelope pore protein 24b, chloroplastic [Quercus suber]